MTDREIKPKEIPLSGKLVSGDSPAMIGDNFRQLTNLRYTDTHPIGVAGMTKINTTALASYPDIKSGFHLRKDLPSESHVIIQAFNSAGTEAKYYDNSTAIPGAGDFAAGQLMTQGSTPVTANWSDAPQGNTVMCDGKGTYIYGGDEIKAGSFIVYAPDASFWYNYTDRIQNTLSNLANIAVLHRELDVIYRSFSYIGSPRPLKGIRPYVAVANTATGTLSMDYFNGSIWTAVGGLSDGTAVAGVPLAVTGDINFTSTDGTAQPSLIDGIVLYWYRMTITEPDATTALYYLTLDAPMQTIKDTWDGVDRPVLAFKQWDNSASTYLDFTTNVFEDSYIDAEPYTYAELDSMPTADNLEIGFFEPQIGLTFRFVPTHENTTASTVATVYYWQGTGYVTVGTITDGTSESTISFAKNGTISWSPITPGNEIKKQIGNEVPLYYYFVSFSSAMDADVQLYHVNGTASPKIIDAYYFPLLAGDSVWLLNELGGKRNRVLRSVPGQADTWNGDLALDFTIGNDKDLIAGAAIYMQIGNNIYEVLVCCKRDETWMIIPTEDALQKFLVDARKGCTAPGTLKTASLSAKDALQTKRNVVVWQSDDAIVIYGGGSVIDISDDIRDYFDQTKSHGINRSYISISQGFFDEKNHYHWLFASGSSTTLNKELVYDTTRDRWYEIDRGTAKYLQCGVEVEDTSGNKYTYGAISQHLERLENGTDYDGNDIVHTLWTGDMPIAESVSHMSKISALGLTCGATNTTTNLIQGSYYRDGKTASDATFTLAPQEAGSTLATPTSQDISVEGNSIFHSLKFSMTTDDETIGFEPLYLYLLYKIIRMKLLGGS